MFIGHYAPALLAAAHSRKPALAWMFVAAQLSDIVFFPLVLAGVEQMRIVPGFTAMNPMDLYHMPYSHSLGGTVALGLMLALLCYRQGRDQTLALWAGLVVLSHWYLDWLVHARDLTLYGQPPKWGLGLWNHPAVEMPLEIGLTLAALGYFFWRAAKAGQAALIRWPLLVLGAVMMILQGYNWFAPEPPPGAPGLAMPLSALIAYALFVWLAWRVDKAQQRTA